MLFGERRVLYTKEPRCYKLDGTAERREGIHFVAEAVRPVCRGPAVVKPWLLSPVGAVNSSVEL